MRFSFQLGKCFEKMKKNRLQKLQHQSGRPLGYEPIETFYINGKFNVDGNDGTDEK